MSRYRAARDAAKARVAEMLGKPPPHGPGIRKVARRPWYACQTCGRPVASCRGHRRANRGAA